MVTCRALTPVTQVRILLPQPAARRDHHSFFVEEVLLESSAVTVATLLTQAGTALTAGLGIVWDMMTANPLLTLFLGASVVSLAFVFFKKAKGAAK